MSGSDAQRAADLNQRKPIPTTANVMSAIAAGLVQAGMAQQIPGLRQRAKQVDERQGIKKTQKGGSPSTSISQQQARTQSCRRQADKTLGLGQRRTQC